MTTLAVRGGTLLTPDRTLEKATLIVADGRIAATTDPSATVETRSAEATIDASGLIVAAGFIDLQVNGGFGYDFTADPATIWQVAAELPRYGVTSFLPTIITSPLETTALAQSVLMQGSPAGWRGARPLGLHLEGPFLNAGKKGAHNPHHLRPPSAVDSANWSPATGVRLVTLAPELPGAHDLIRSLTGRGIVVSAGHSMATYEEARAGIEAGVRYGTHLFNAMTAVHHRDPGLPGALLADDRVTIGLIPDGLHVHPALVKLIWSMTGPDRLNVVTDAMAALGMPPGDYLLGDHNVQVDSTKATLADGTLAGCIVSLDEALRKLVAYTGCSFAEAVRTVTRTPAQLLGLPGRYGALQPGAEADFVLLMPNMQVVATFVAGACVYSDGIVVPSI